jgi:hypothetical protein
MIPEVANLFRYLSSGEVDHSARMVQTVTADEHRATHWEVTAVRRG